MYVREGYWRCGYTDPCGDAPLVVSRKRNGLLLSEPLPLRSTRMLGDYSEDVALQWVLGDMTAAPFKAIRLSSTRYFAADHPMEVTKAFTARQQVYNWLGSLKSDGAGNTWTEVEFDAAIPQDVDVWLCGRGYRDPDTGDLVQNFGDALGVVSNTIGKRSDDWSGVRAESSAFDLKAAGVLDTRDPIKVVLDSVTLSAGIIWWHGGARLYPTAVSPSPILDLDVAELADLQAVATLNDTADILRIAYDYSPAGNRPLHHIELTASPMLYGGIIKEVSYPFLRTPQNAEAVGRPVLQRLAGKRYDVTFTTTNKAVRPGVWVRPVAHPDWMVSADDPVIMILECEIDRDTKETRVTRAETIIDPPNVTVTAYSVALPDEISAAIDVSVSDGIATFTITDENGRPLSKALVSLDGAAAKATDAQGKVRFPVDVVVGEPVNHELFVEAPGYQAFSVVVPL